MLKKLRSNIAFTILAGVVFVLALMSVIVSATGYYQFTGSIENQYAESAYNTARSAVNFVVPGFLTAEDITQREWQFMYSMVRREWQRLADTQNATYIYLFKAEGSEYDDVTFLASVANTASHFTPFNSGFRIKQTDVRYLDAFKKIYDDKAPGAEIAVYRPEGDKFVSGNHITVMLPVHDTMGHIIGVIGVERKMEELDNIRSNYLRHVAVITIIMLLIVVVVYGSYLDKNLLTPIKNIASEAFRFAHENTKPESPLADNIKIVNEIGQLARTIDTMELDILNYIENLTRVTQEKEQIKAELNVATQIQADMLPRVFPVNNTFELTASMTPAKEVGGDFYDFFFIDDDHLALVMADVSGKGVPAALFMVIAKTLIKNRAQMGGRPSEILADVNNQLCETNDADLFVTVWLGIFELSTGHIIASNAGHEYPAVMRAGENYELLTGRNSPAVATMEGMRFRENEFDLNHGDILFLYTDGVAEATNSSEELYGTDRMIDDLNKTKGKNSADILKSMKHDVDAFTGEAPQFDDITMLCVRYFGGDKS